MAGSLGSIFYGWKLKLADVDFDNIAEIRAELYRLIPDLIFAAESTGGIGPEKRAAVLLAVGAWYDRVIAPKDLPSIPDWIADPLLRFALIKSADEGIDLAVAVMNRYGLLKGVSA